MFYDAEAGEYEVEEPEEIEVTDEELAQLKRGSFVWLPRLGATYALIEKDT
ncbi:hypothetical protein [Paraburkholderia xenovorans]|uniref:hypothetical protein n=1 Tax=Paraburkholderia xenovorans TaxID=36873 RepID=UPI0015C533E9|nr:hypothetical protein [Paraburkholderia xenovorans]NPT38963.1 hypothetical protein [Paraburkholderia xenovorans]